MVAGYQRLNEKKSQPNPHVVFIKPLEGPDKQIAQDFLERIAAQCRELTGFLEKLYGVDVCPYQVPLCEKTTCTLLR